jgi:hypothetical protein
MSWDLRYSYSAMGGLGPVLRSGAPMDRKRNLGRSFHLAPKGKWAHIRPDAFNVLEALFLCSGFAGIFPSQGILTIERPDGVLFFMVHHNFINAVLFILV